MSIISLQFILFILILLICYYMIPSKYQWAVLLLGSVVFYFLNSKYCLIYVLLTSFSTYFSTISINKITSEQKKYFEENKELSKEEKNNIKKSNNHKKRVIMIACLLFNFGILSIFKYYNFFITQVNNGINLFGGNIKFSTYKFIVPLGISFYTFQTMGYLIDVYWGKYEAETNYLKVLLFNSFFPQIIQGPISDFKQLTNEFYKKHILDFSRISLALQRITWGFYKKIVIADQLAPQVMNVFENYHQLQRLTVIAGMFMYSIQIYADFSGYMDIMCGVCQLFDIRLRENFDRPYFSKSVAEYWRRWHISLGDWFKKYLYYPIGMSKWNRNFCKKIGIKLNVKTQNLTATIALIAVWFTTGLWHGATWSYIAWGGLNGLFIILSMWLEPVNNKVKKILRINEKSIIWKWFQILRTFILVTYIKVLPEVGTLADGVGLWIASFTNQLRPVNLFEIIPFEFSTTFSLCIGIILILINSIMAKDESNLGIKNANIIIKYILFVYLIVEIIIYGNFISPDMRGFMYAQF